MKRRFSNVVLSLLLLLSLAACATEIQGSQSAVIYGRYGASDSLIDLPVQEPDTAPQEPDASQGNLPDTSQGDVSQGSLPDASQGNFPDDSQGNLPDAGQGSSNGGEGNANPSGEKGDDGNRSVDEDGWYTSKEEVALYIHLYGELPDNYVTKREAEEAGWSGGNVERYTGEGTAIGGSYFGNYEGLLPKERGRTYSECDIDTVGGNSRGAKRIIFSNDGLIYYTDDHYESFELLYGEP